MAIIRSVAMGRARKSAGNITFRTVRGRTIASEKRGPNPVTRGDESAQVLQRRGVFAAINRFARVHGPSIGVSFTRSRYGSSRNAFFKKNYAPLLAAFSPIAGTPELVEALTDAELETAVTEYATANPNSIRRIDLAGQPVVYLNGAWSSIPDPAPIEPEQPFSVTQIANGGNALPFSTTAASNAKDIGGDVTITGTGLTGVTAARLINVGGSVDEVDITEQRDDRLVMDAGFADPNGRIGISLIVTDGTAQNFYFL